MSFKDKPLKKIVSDKRITIDAIHQDITDSFSVEKSKYKGILEDKQKLEEEFKNDPSMN